MSARKTIPIGTRFGRLKVISHGFKKGNRFYRVSCECDCGTIKDITEWGLKEKTRGTKSCGCLFTEGLPYNALSKGESNFNQLYNNYRGQANRKEQEKREFNLSKEEFKSIIIRNCHYCGEKPKQKINTRQSNGAFIYNGIDRKNNNIGYIYDNCVPCCKKCNTLKRSMSYGEFITYLTKIYNHWLKLHIGIEAYPDIKKKGVRQ